MFSLLFPYFIDYKKLKLKKIINFVNKTKKNPVIHKKIIVINKKLKDVNVYIKLNLKITPP